MDKNEITSGLAETAKELRLSNYGLTINDTDGSNFSKLCAALDTGKKIIVDNMYNMKIVTPYVLKKDVILYGETPLCGFIFDNPNNSYVFSPIGNLNIKMYQLKISGVTNTLFHNLILTNFIKEVDVSYCDFSGQIAFIRLNIANGDFDQAHGCGDLLFKYNKLRDLKISNIDSALVDGFITINNIPFNTFTFNDNNVNNFSSNIIYAGITNSYTDTSRLALNRKIINVNRNIVINDDGFYDDVFIRPYHSLLVAECNTVIYRHNHVEGLKSARGKAVYDIYASCLKYFCENNTWKNNISFNIARDGLYNCLMEFKGNPVESENAQRVIRGNIYTIDPDFAARHGKDEKWLHVFLTKVTSPRINIDITDNIIDVPYLNFGNSAYSPKNYRFSNNRIISKRVMGAIIRLSSASLWKDTLNSSIEIFNNTIIAEEENIIELDYAKQTSNYFTLMYHSYSSKLEIPKLKNINISNNYIKGDMRSLYPFSGLFEFIHAESMIFSNNTIVNIANAVYTNSISRLFYNSQFNTLVAIGNIFENLNIDGGFYYSADVIEEFFEKVLIDNYISAKNYNASLSISTIPFINQTASRKLRFDIKYNIIKPDLTEYVVKFKFIIEYGKFTYINSKTNEKSVLNLTGSASGITYFTESNMLRLYLRDDASLPYGRKVGVGLVPGADLSNCDIYMTLRINTEPNTL